jgi:hypothetical protein
MKAGTFISVVAGLGIVATGVVFAQGGKTKSCVQLSYNAPVAPAGTPCNGSYEQFETANEGTCRGETLVDLCTETVNPVLLYRKRYVQTSGQNCGWQVVTTQVTLPGGAVTTVPVTTTINIKVCVNG